MPAFVKSEKKWDEAKKAAGKDGGETKWALANYIYHKMDKSAAKEAAQKRKNGEK